MGEAAEREGDEQCLRVRRRARHAHPGGVAARGAGERQDALHQGDDEREREGELAEFRDHGRWIDFCAFSTAWAASGGM